MSAFPVIRQGEDLDFIFDLNGEDITGWICLIQVAQFFGENNVALISRIVSPTQNAWEGQLSSTETAGLDVSSDSPYFLTGFLTNSGTDQERQIPKRFHVSAPWA